MMLRNLSLMAIFLVGFASDAARAQELAQRRVLTIDEQPKWSGVGRLNHSLGGFCSGALIAEDVVLTAAHCVIDKETNAPVPIGDLRFVAGLRAGAYTANRRAVSATIHPEWGGYVDGDRINIAGDLAIVKLETPITRLEARQFELGPSTASGTNVSLVSYGRGRENALSIQEPCQVVGLADRVAVLNCDSIEGTSGAPVFHNGKIVGVVSARDTEPGGLTYAVWIEEAIDALMSGRAIVKDAETWAPPSPAEPASGGRASDLFTSAPTWGHPLRGGKKAPT